MTLGCRWLRACVNGAEWSVDGTCAQKGIWLECGLNLYELLELRSDLLVCLSVCCVGPGVFESSSSSGRSRVSRLPYCRYGRSLQTVALKRLYEAK